MKPERLPPRASPLLFLGIAHVAAAGAATLLVLEPDGLLGSRSDPRLLAIVHLLTVGWISGSILGSLYLVPSMALRARVVAGPGDTVAAAVFALGVALLASRLWSGDLRSVAAAAVPVVAALAWVAARVGPAIVAAPVPGAVRAHFVVAIANAFLGIGLGMALASGRITPAAGAPWALGAAHAVLLVFGWGAMMVMAAGYRLIPMILPSAMPAGLRVVATVWLGELGVLTLAAGFGLDSIGLLSLGGTATLVWLVVFLCNVRWMYRNPKPRARAVPRRDLPAFHVLAAVLVLLVVGAWLAVRLVLAGSVSERELVVTGVLLLLGFLGQMIVGVAQRLAPWLAWLWAFAQSGYEKPPPVPYPYFLINF